jgi:hypothetical protein
MGKRILVTKEVWEREVYPFFQEMRAKGFEIIQDGEERQHFYYSSRYLYTFWFRHQYLGEFKYCFVANCCYYIFRSLVEQSNKDYQNRKINGSLFDKWEFLIEGENMFHEKDF